MPDLNFDPNRIYTIKQGFILREIAGETTIIPVDPDSDIRNGVLLPNGTAAFLWKIFERSSTAEEAIQQLLDSYDVQESTARNAVQRFVTDLLKYRIIEGED